MWAAAERGSSEQVAAATKRRVAEPGRAASRHARAVATASGSLRRALLGGCIEARVEPPRPPLAPVAHSRRSLRSSSPALAVHVQRRLRTEGIAKWAVRLGVRRAQSGVSVVPGTAAAGGAVLGRSERLSDMAERTCAEPPGTHPREGAARGGAARPVDLDLAEVVGRPAGAQRRRHGHRGAADTPRRVLGP